MMSPAMGRRTRAAVSVAATIGAIVATDCRRAGPPPAVLQTVRGGTVERVQPDATDRYSATIQPSRQVDLAFKSPGIVEAIHQVRGVAGRPREVQSGDRVAAGTELARVRAADYQQRIAQVQAQVRQAQSQKAQLEAVRGQAELDQKRASALFQSASVTKPEFDQAQTRLQSAQAQSEAAQGAIEAAQATLAQATLALDDTRVLAPFDGWVTARNVEVGSLVGNASIGFSLVDTRTVKALFAVPDTSLKGVTQGQRVAVALDAMAGPVEGSVTGIAVAADARTHVFSVEVSIPNPRDEIRPGMIGSLVLGPPKAATARLVVPLSAIVRAPGGGAGFAVFALEMRGGKTVAVARRVSVGDTFGNAIEITEGLHVGDRIVSEGGELLRDGEEVRVRST